jgi:hypothetical protein
MARGLRFSCDDADIIDGNTFQDDDGKPMAYVKMAYFGGTSTIMLDAAEYKRFQPFIGKTVSVSGTFTVEKKDKGLSKVKFDLAEIKAK